MKSNHIKPRGNFAADRDSFNGTSTACPSVYANSWLALDTICTHISVFKALQEQKVKIRERVCAPSAETKTSVEPGGGHMN